MTEVGLERNRDFKLYLMAEIPANIFMAAEFSDYCDGFSIGSNDLTQLTMGADRDSDVLGKMGYFDERNDAIKRAIRHPDRRSAQEGKDRFDLRTGALCLPGVHRIPGEGGHRQHQPESRHRNGHDPDHRLRGTEAVAGSGPETKGVSAPR